MGIGNDYSIEVRDLEVHLKRGNMSIVVLGSYENKRDLEFGLEFCKKHMKRVVFLYDLYLESEYLNEQKFLLEFIRDTCLAFQGNVADRLVEEFA